MSEPASQRTRGPAPRVGRRSRRARFGAALLALLAVAGYVTLRGVTGDRTTSCTVRADGADLTLLPQQAANAATIAAVAASRDLPERALTIALATALQESKLRDIGGGDRDSLGLFQQRPSQGWGTAEQIMDPVYSANEFFDELVKIPGYTRLPLTAAAQQVQHSGYPQAYAKRESDAALLAAALSGRMPTLSCTVRGGGAGDPAAVRRRLLREFGAQPTPSNAPGSWATGMATSGRTIIVSPDPDTDSTEGPVDGRATTDRARHGWVLAQWAVAHAAGLRIARIVYRGRLWRAADSDKGWVAGPAESEQVYGNVLITVAE